VSQRTEASIVEHVQTGDPYDAKNTWLYSAAKCDFVATATWAEEKRHSDNFNGSSRHMQTVMVRHAESNDLDALRGWADLQQSAGAAQINIHRTWPISPTKRDNAFLEKRHPLRTRAAQ
jgi:hypothetical protein